MAARKGTGQAREWLLKGSTARAAAAKRRKGTDELGEQTRQWLAPKRPKRRSRPVRAGGSDPAARLRTAERKLIARERQIAQLNERVETLEAELGGRKPPGEPRADRIRTANGGDRRRRRKREEDGRLDLNQATFEELRGLDLSVTQTARVIVSRETQGGYRSLKDVEQVPGISRRTLTQLRGKVSVFPR